MKSFSSILRANFLTTGLAMFAMFFGSGNLIFPVAIGQMAGAQNIWAILGLFVTAVLLPFLTLVLMLFYDGDYHRFFKQVGFIPGKLIIFIILALIGPFGGLPRCIAFSYSTFSIYTESMGIFWYSLVACILVFFLSIRKSRVVGIIGNLLTPILLLSLSVIVVRGLMIEPSMMARTEAVSDLSMLKRGLLEGYKTFDIFAALFLATAIMPAFHNVLGRKALSHEKGFASLALGASVVGALTLFVVYAGLSFVAANLSEPLAQVKNDQFLGAIATMTMGDLAGLVANVTVSMACLTTAITLALISAQFLSQDVFLGKVSYFNSLILTMAISFLVSLLGFNGIMAMVLPILTIICPAIITLVITSSFKYLYGFRYGRELFYLVLAVSIVVTVFS